MYRPTGGYLSGGGIRGYQQRGGDYISSVMINQLNLSSTSTISYSSLLYILSSAHLSSLADVGSLTQAQLADLAKSVQAQIDADNSQISINNLSIGTLLHQINDPGGLQDQYNAANSKYLSDMSSYQSTSTAIVGATNLLSSQQLYYSTLMISSALLTSSLISYQYQYSTALSTLNTDQQLLDAFNLFDPNDAIRQQSGKL